MIRHFKTELTDCSTELNGDREGRVQGFHEPSKCYCFDILETFWERLSVKKRGGGGGGKEGSTDQHEFLHHILELLIALAHVQAQCVPSSPFRPPTL